MPNKITTQKIPPQRTRAKLDVSTFNEANRTVEVTFATETAVRSYDWDFGDFNEVLSLDPLHVDLTRLKAGAPALDNHNVWESTANVVVGVVEDAWIAGNEGRARIRFSSSPDDEKLMNKVKDGIVTGVSVGYDVFSYEVTRSDVTIPTLRAVNWMPTEISFVPVQADINSRVRSEDAAPHDVTLNETVPEPAPAEAAPVVEETTEIPTENQNNNVNNDEMTEEETLAAANLQRSATQKEERDRISGIRKHVRALKLKDGDAFAETLIEEGVALDVAMTRSLAQYETEQPANPNPTIEQVNTDAEKTRSAMTDAIVLRANPSAATKLPAESVRAAQDYKGMTFLRMAEESLIRAGVRTAGLTPKAISTLALGGKVRGMHHTTDFPLLLVDAFDRTLRAAYELQPRTFQVWAKRTTLPDFRNITRVQLSGLVGNLEQVLEGQEYKYGSFDTASETYKLNKYGKIVSITWEAIVNDDLSAFTRIPQAFAMKAAQLQSNLVYNILINNPVMGDGIALFNAATHKNTVAASALAESSLTAALKLFRNQKSIEGDFINVSPRFLIVGPELEFLAGKLTSTAYTPQKQADITPSAITGLTVVVEPRITDFSWFLVADPNMIDTVEYAFLDGEEELFIEEREGFNVDGTEIKARMVFGTKAIDWRGMFKNPGLAPA